MKIYEFTWEPCRWIFDGARKGLANGILIDGVLISTEYLAYTGV